MKAWGVAAATALFASAVSADVDPIVIKGSKFFYKTNGTQFYMRGVAYQQDVSTNTSSTETDKKYSDPIADVKGCSRDIPYLAQLRTNVIRVYAIDPEQNHDECMNKLADAGIYVIADLSQPGESINRDDPAWNDDLYTRYTQVIDAMAKYTNTLGFFAGNEVSNAPNNTAASAFVKAAVRDSKAYIKQKDYRPIGVGYATNDDADIRLNLAHYFNCGDKPEEAIDFWGYNIYSWCGDSSFQKSGYDVRTKEFATYSVPAFFAEYGCNEVKPRRFTDVPTLYGKDMNGIWSGGIVYMYFQEDNKFGLVKVNGDSVDTLDDFDNLKGQLAKINPPGVKMNDYNPTNTKPQDCPKLGSSWAASPTLPPSANADLCQCMTSSLTCKVADKTDEKSFGKIFNYICGADQKNCAGIAHNATTAEYGAYSVCNAREQLSFVIDRYVKAQKNAASACDFNGAATGTTASTSGDNCKKLLDEAGPNGETPVGGGPSAANTKKKNHAGAVTVPSVNLGVARLGLYVLGAAFTGAGLIIF